MCWQVGRSVSLLMCVSLIGVDWGGMDWDIVEGWGE